LHHAIWREEGNSLARSTGIVLKESLFVQCFLEDGMEYVPPGVWNSLSELDGKWTADFSNPEQSTVIVGHESDYDFEWGTEGSVTDAENRFMLATPDAKRIVGIPEDNRRGLTDRTKHILLRG